MQPSVFAGLGIIMAGCFFAVAPLRAEDAPPSPLPLRDVVLFSSGVGYFQRSGQVNGTATVDLSFRTEQVNDILKSLVLFDPQGAVRPVSYTTADPVSRQLRSAGLSVNGSISLGGLLRQFQGARVHLETSGEPVEGRILSVAEKPEQIKDTTVTVEVLNVLTEGGLRALRLEQVRQVKLLDERLDTQLRQSLALLATGLDDQRRAVALHFAGDGAREVRAGYLVEMPVWKTAYRLVLDDVNKPYLQGWAIVENTTDEDWKEVRLSLVSGRPVSFIQDLYQPLYVPRPQVAPQVIGSPIPQTYAQTLELPAAPPPVAAPEAAEEGRPEGAAGAPRARRAAPMGRMGGGMGGGGLGGALADSDAERRRDLGMSAEKLAQSVASQAQGTERGALFEYAIRQPLSLPRQQAAMVPIVTETVEGQPLSIYDPASDAAHALNGFRLKNSTGLHLAGGPVTVFAGGIYAGDAEIGHLQPGDDRLLSYAVDLDLVASHEEPKFRQDTVSVSAKSGVLVITRKQQRENLYTFRNQSDKPKNVLIQQAVEPEFQLIEPAKAEKTPAQYRFMLPVPAKQTASLKVVTERPVTEQVALLNADINFVVEYAQNAQLSPKLRGALKQLVDLRRHVTDLQARIAALDSEIKAIDQEQARIRQNMAQLDRNSPLYQQYVKKLTDQETQIEKTRAAIAQARSEELAAGKAVREFVDQLTAD